MKMKDRINEIIFILNNVKYDKKGLTTNVKRYDYSTDKWCEVKDDLLDFSTNTICIHFKFKNILKYLKSGYDIEEYLPKHQTWVKINHLVNFFDEDNEIISFLKGLGQLRIASNAHICSGNLIDKDKSLIDLLKRVKINDKDEN